MSAPAAAAACGDTRERIFAAIVDHCREHGGVAPTLRELAQAVGLMSLAGIKRHLARLEEAGRIRLHRDAGGLVCARGISVVGATWSWTPPGDDDQRREQMASLRVLRMAVAHG